MKYILSGILCIVFNLLTFNVFAVNIYECEDADGNRTFQERCPPGTTPVQEKKYSTGKKSQSSSGNAEINATLYSIPECEPCQEIREFLTVRKVSFNDKNVKDNIELQNELTELTGGELRVPVVIIGENKVFGYSRDELLNALKAAGYVEPGSDESADETAVEPAQQPE